MSSLRDDSFLNRLLVGALCFMVGDMCFMQNKLVYFDVSCDFSGMRRDFATVECKEGKGKKSFFGPKKSCASGHLWGMVEEKRLRDLGLDYYTRPMWRALDPDATGLTGLSLRELPQFVI